MTVARIAISLEPELLKKLETRMSEGVYHNRSKVVSDILRDWFLKEEMAGGRGSRIGTISVVYNHHARGVLDRITEIQHRFGASVIATMHIHLTHDDCLEVIAARGNAAKIKKIVDAVSSVRGVTSCRVSVVG
jgi:CopG family transcriptional regulator, nickel-responsive regulator